ncbi:copper amine oxidase N-terminal domain-containing protein [Paenibacillus eucommiae]|uniref:Copper amine oxidase-like N-terminal domain-containing protein n=1 Tax=Paenibacillus eucommiae TaxID=1355755 RepID=A0ABS4ITR5_9BACL|nr:copper amine oxidase N-terminal domain-containing protein [Paenibacillus eucommiae]MBP1989969.1 hypothetical protein [Paenibacillus eucommiae]
MYKPQVFEKVNVLQIGFMLLLIMCVIGVSPGKATAAAAPPPIKVFVDVTPIQFEVDPLLKQGTTLVPFRPLFEAMGMEVEWNSEQRLVTGTKTGLDITLKIDNINATINGKTAVLSQAPTIISGNTMVPLRFIGEATGAVVAWDGPNREITIFTEKFWQGLGITKAELEKRLEGFLTTDTPAAPKEDKPASPKPDVSKGSGEYAPSSTSTVDLSKLLGMYYGFRDDLGGSECGGICWDFYTFLPGNKVIIGESPHGGPDTLDCTQDACSPYTISNGTMKLDNGDTFAIAKSDKGKLMIDEVSLEPVKPAAKGLMLEGKYKYQGYSGLIGIDPYSSSWTEYITFNKNGAFESKNLSLSSLQGGSSSTNATKKESSTGTYVIEGNTIVLTFKDGTTQSLLFFIHENTKRGPLEDIQIGDRNFYIDK